MQFHVFGFSLLCSSVLWLLAAYSAVAAPRVSGNAGALAREGRNLTVPQVAKLEEALEADPDDLTVRTKLLGYYNSKRWLGTPEEKAAHERHALWIIRNRPGAEIAGDHCASLNVYSQATGYAEGRKLWLKHAKANGNDTSILGNAAEFFLLSERWKGIEFLSQAERLEPKESHWPQRIGHFYLLDAAPLLGGDPSAEKGKAALAAFERALEKGTVRDTYSLVQYVGKSALYAGDYAKVKKYASEMLTSAVGDSASWNYGNAVHHGNLLLGHAALQEDDLTAAEEYLLKAGKTPGSPQLNSFGPNMLLAKKLLEKGRKQAVIEYLKLCGVFWKKPKIAKWIEAVEGGQIPGFGGNLLY